MWPTRSRAGASRPAATYRAALELIPITKPIFERYRSLLAEEYPHLELS